VASIQATTLLFPSLCTATVVDLDTLYQDILSALPSDPIATKHISADGQWSMDSNSFLLLDNRIYVPSTSNLRTCILQYTVLIYNNSASPVSLAYNLSHNVTSPTDLSNNFLSLNDYGIPFLWTSSRNFCHSPDLTLSWS